MLRRPHPARLSCTGVALAEAAGISVSWAQRILRAHGFQPYRVRQFKSSKDRDFIGKTSPGGRSRERPIDFSATTLQLDVHVGDVSAAGLDAYSLGSAVGRERDPGAKGGGAQFAFEAACGDTPSHVTGYVSRSFLPVSLDPLAGSFDVAGDVKLEAFARAHNRLVQSQTLFRLRVLRSAADRLAVAIRSNDLAGAPPDADELFKRAKPPQRQNAKR